VIIELTLLNNSNLILQDSVPLRALDIGCAVGRSSFELCQKFADVVGLDYSQAFIDACNTLKQNGEMPYFIQDEGDLVTNLKAVIPKSLVNKYTFKYL
jgi:SAM-dependent methyltransferase